MNPDSQNEAGSRAGPLLWLLAGLVLLRFAGMEWLPLMDTTEARYGEIARKMAQLGDWVTPWHDVGVPFWGKPPLSFWLTALSFTVFGIGEFSARLPHFLCSAAMAVVTWGLAQRHSREEARYAVALLAGSALFFVSAGAVMTDAALVLGTTLAMAGFWLGMTSPPASPHPARWLLFAGMALGLLAKGPLALVLIGAPALLWTVAGGRVRFLHRAFPWVLGLGAVAAAVLPWYIAAEVRTPGFLQYFLAGEHWHRFLTPGWKGDLYGNAHQFARGTIWVFAIAAMAPWSLLLPAAAAWRRWRSPAPAAPMDRRWVAYLVWWTLTPLVFFTAAGNIIWTYALPALPAAALLGAHWLASWNAPLARRVVCAGLVLTLAGALAFGWQVSGSGSRVERHSARSIVNAYQRHCEHAPLLYLGARSHSIDFYSAGRAQRIADPRRMPLLVGEAGACLVASPRDVEGLPAPAHMSMRAVARIGDVVLLRIARDQPEGADRLASMRRAPATRER